MGTKLIKNVNDLNTVNPQLAAEWDFEKNGELHPDMVTAGSSRKVWWKGNCGHEWQATISSRNTGVGCPVCARENNKEKLKQTLLRKNGSLLERNPELAKEWDTVKNGDLKPWNVTPNTHEKVWWKGKCGHEWQASVKARNMGTGCPFCSASRVKKGFNDLETVAPEIAKSWNKEKNGTLSPSDVTAGSSIKVWWKCEKGHEWCSSIKSRSEGNGCPVCSGKTILKNYNDLASRRPDIAKEWHPEKNGEIKPEDVTVGSHKKVWWKCEKGHEWQATPNHRTSQKRNCPYCCGNPKVLKGINDLETVNPTLAAEWHTEKNGPLKPSDVTGNSNKKVWWRCKKGHEWKTSVNHRANGSGCPACSGGLQTSYPEQVVYYYVKRFYPDAVNGYTDIFNCHGMELDVYVPSCSLGIEYDGAAFHKGEVKKNREIKKYDICKQNNIFLIRIKENHCDTEVINSDAVIFTRDTLDDTVAQLKEYLDKILDVNTDRDADAIKASYYSVLDEKSLAKNNPVLAAEWHPTKNGTLTPEMFMRNSNDKVWWICSEGHEWKASIDARNSGTGCPYCTNHKLLTGYNDLETKNPGLAAEWHPTKNGDLKPSMVFPGSGKKAWWICKKGHEWQAEISSRNKGHGCPVCAGNQKRG